MIKICSYKDRIMIYFSNDFEKSEVKRVANYFHKNDSDITSRNITECKDCYIIYPFDFLTITDRMSLFKRLKRELI